MKGQRWRWGLGFILLWLEISVNYAQVVQMVEGQGQLCKVEFHIFLCKHNLIRTGQIYSLNSEEERNSKKRRHTTSVLSAVTTNWENRLLLSQYQHFKWVTRFGKLLIWHCQQLSLWFWDMLSTQGLSREQSHISWVPWKHLKRVDLSFLLTSNWWSKSEWRFQEKHLFPWGIQVIIWIKRKQKTGESYDLPVLLLLKNK